jgi:hypothetical protein
VPFWASRPPCKNFLKILKKTLDFPIAIWFNAIISLGAEEKTHREEERECVLFDSARFLEHVFSATLQEFGGKENSQV